MDRELIIVADARRAKFYEAKGSKIVRQPIEILLAKNSNIKHMPNSTRQGFYHRASTQSHFLDPHTELKRLEIIEFSRQIAHTLDRIYETKHYERLILVATPKILGAIRDNLKNKLKQIIFYELSKELINTSYDELEARIFGKHGH